MVIDVPNMVNHVICLIDEVQSMLIDVPNMINHVNNLVDNVICLIDEVLSMVIDVPNIKLFFHNLFFSLVSFLFPLNDNSHSLAQTNSSKKAKHKVSQVPNLLKQTILQCKPPHKEWLSGFYFELKS